MLFCRASKPCPITNGMSVFRNVYVTPIHLPQEQFKDAYGNPNAYIPMNPSLRIEPDGAATLLVRCVNYRKYKDRQFTLYEKPWSVSTYKIIRGQVDGFLEGAVETLKLGGTEQYPTYWKGMEDIRFVDDDILVTIPERNPKGNPSIFLGKIEGNTVTCTPCFPNEVEKNWMPFFHKERMVVYSVEPFVIKRLVEPELTRIPSSLGLHGYHGSTNGIPYKGWILFLIHQSRDISYHRWLMYKPDEELKASKEFVFFRNTYIEFPCSLCEYQSRIFISLGVNDDRAYIVEVSPEDIDAAFT